MKNIFVFGRNGMLGNYVYSYFKNDTEYTTVGITRKDVDLTNITEISLKYKLISLGIKEDDVVINCAGVIPQRNSAEALNFILVNSVFPHYLNNICKEIRVNFINISTDCTFTGKTGSYNEDHLHDATDIYGRTKSLGEPEGATTIRTSIIGEEVSNFCSLIEWVKSNKNKDILGYTNHLWNGIACLQFAKVCEYMIDNAIFWPGIKHITSPNSVSKYELLKLISKVYDLNIKVTPHTTGISCDKTMVSIKENVGIIIPELKTQLIDQREFSKENLLWKQI